MLRRRERARACEHRRERVGREAQDNHGVRGRGRERVRDGLAVIVREREPTRAVRAVEHRRAGRAVRGAAVARCVCVRHRERVRGHIVRERGPTVPDGSARVVQRDGPNGRAARVRAVRDDDACVRVRHCESLPFGPRVRSGRIVRPVPPLPRIVPQ